RASTETFDPRQRFCLRELQRCHCLHTAADNSRGLEIRTRTSRTHPKRQTTWCGLLAPGDGPERSAWSQGREALYYPRLCRCRSRCYRIKTHGSHFLGTRDLDRDCLHVSPG